jgi:hypothetical protein
VTVALFSTIGVDILTIISHGGGEHMNVQKQSYTKPVLKTWGNVADLTQTGCTNPGMDGMFGSVTSDGRPPVDCNNLGKPF